MTTDLTTATPVEIDTELARIWGEIDKVHVTITHIKRDLTRKIAYGAKLGQPTYTGENREYLENKLTEAKVTLDALRAEVEPYEIEYSRRPWNRYFLVKNTNGHVHRGMNCSTCFYDTQYAWLIDLADCDESAMIEEWGEMACTVCFPDAPTNPLYNRPSRRDREAQAAREAEKAERQAKKQAKLLNERIVLPDPWGHHGERIETIAAAKQAIRDAIGLQVWATNADKEAIQARIDLSSAALLATGRVTQEEITKIITTATKKARKDGA
jgi:hypothetical protein